MPPPLCNLDGEIVPEAEARVPVLDRGFLFGDSVYEVMRTTGGVPFAWPEHLERLRRSAAGIGLEIDLDDRAIMTRVKATIGARERAEAGSGGEHYLRIIITRGTGTAPSIDLAFAPGPPRTVILARDLPAAPPTTTLAMIPRLRTDRRSLDPAIKSGNYLNNVLGLAEAKARGAADCLFLNQEGKVTEASTANVYVVRGGEVITPPLSAGLLEGTTRRLLIECCREIGVSIVERDLNADDVRTAEEVFLSSTLRDLLPVVAVDGEPVGDGTPGPVTRRLSEAFRDFCARRVAEVYAPRYAEI